MSLAFVMFYGWQRINDMEYSKPLSNRLMHIGKEKLKMKSYNEAKSTLLPIKTKECFFIKINTCGIS